MFTIGLFNAHVRQPPALFSKVSHLGKINCPEAWCQQDGSETSLLKFITHHPFYEGCSSDLLKQCLPKMW